MSESRFIARLTEAPLSEEELRAFVAAPESGGVVVFTGVVRNHNAGRSVVKIEYTAARELAEVKLAEVAGEVVADPAVHRVAAAHRVGVLGVGEASVMVAASAAHREEAFRAARRLIDRIKEIVPVWKNEHFEDGSVEWAPGFTVSTADRVSGTAREEIGGC